LREIVDKQPGLKSGLREYVIKKAGNKARVASFLEVFGEADKMTPPQAMDASPPPP
jgi:symplekin